MFPTSTMKAETEPRASSVPRLRSPPAHRPAEGTATPRFFAYPLLRRPLRFGELGDQRVARLLQLLNAGDVGDGAARRRRQLLGAEVARVARQLGLEPADLAAQLLAHLDRLALPGKVGEAGRQRRRCLPPVAGDARAGHRHDRQLARAVARLGGAAQGVGGDLFQLGGRDDAGGNEGPLALTADNQSVGLEPLIHRPHGVEVDPRPLREAAEARQALAAPQLAGGDKCPQPPGQLQPNRQLVAGIDREGVGRGPRRRTPCYIINSSTVSSITVLVKQHTVGPCPLCPPARPPSCSFSS